MRKWSMQEANAALPKVKTMLRNARDAAAVARDAQLHMDDLRTAYGDDVYKEDHPSHREWSVWHDKREAGKLQLARAVAAFEEAGIVIKDVDLGLVDFHADHLGQTVLLCWKDGETAVEHWHPLDGGYAKRKPLPRITGA